jgi:hypothetical protein
VEFAAAVVAGLVAAVLTLLELDRTFYVPKDATSSRRAFYTWWWGFVLGNGILATTMFYIVRNIEVVQTKNRWVVAIIVGLSYLAIARLKFITLNLKGKDVGPVGVEFLYDKLKEVVYERINNIASEARQREAEKMANSSSLMELGAQAKTKLDTDALMPKEQKYEDKEWILRVLRDTNATEHEKKLILANYIASGERSVQVM